MATKTKKQPKPETQLEVTINAKPNAVATPAATQETPKTETQPTGPKITKMNPERAMLAGAILKESGIDVNIGITDEMVKRNAVNYGTNDDQARSDLAWAWFCVKAYLNGKVSD